jgi:hypothetical protein
MCRVICFACGFAALLTMSGARLALAQEEVVHPGETYDSLQAGQDAYGDAEAQRRALIGRQLMLEEQIQAQNTWSDPQDKYRPVRPESYGPVRPQLYIGPTLADVYAYPQSGIVYYGGQPTMPSTAANGGAYAAPVPAFQSWPRVSGDIWGTPYYGYVRQPIGHVKIWTSRLGYIYKPVYASPAMETAPAASSYATAPRRYRAEARPWSLAPPVSPGSSPVPPPPPKPSVPAAAGPAVDKVKMPGGGQEI